MTPWNFQRHLIVVERRTNGFRARWDACVSSIHMYWNRMKFNLILLQSIWTHVD
jgi:hypothetical protein